jgi:hypothetical protein
MKVQLQWELRNLEGGTFIWNHNRSRFDFVQSDHIMDEAVYKLMMEITTPLAAEILESGWKCFEIRPVFAVRI